MFERGRVYRRDELHHAWDGATRVQQQGGILTPVEAPLVIVVTGEEGGQYGYDDYWDAGRRVPLLRRRPGRRHGVCPWESRAPGSLRERRGGPPFRAGVGRPAIRRTDGLRRLLRARRRPRSQRRPYGARSCSSSLRSTTSSRSRATSERRVPRPTRAGRCRSTSSATAHHERSGISRTRARQSVRTYERSEDLRVYVRRRADGRCEGCGSPAPFMTARGHPYLEPHHTRRLSDGGPDDYHHVIALCPTCHRRVHHAGDGESYNVELTPQTRVDRA